jgi:hypothetical protein
METKVVKCREEIIGNKKKQTNGQTRKVNANFCLDNGVHYTQSLVSLRLCAFALNYPKNLWVIA